MPAYQFAVENGVDTLEMDMHVTKDNVIVLTHDPYLNPKLCIDKNGKAISGDILVHGLTLKELQSYDCGALQNPKFSEQQPVPKTPIPTLEQLFIWAKNKKVRFNIETKSEEAHPEYTPDPETFVKMFLQLVHKYKLLDRVILQSFDYRTLEIAHRLEPKLRLAVLIEFRPSGGTKALVELMQKYHAQILSPNGEWLTKEDVEAMHKIGAQVIPWTINTKEEWTALMQMGVDGIITDNPRGLVQFTKAK